MTILLPRTPRRQSGSVLTPLADAVFLLVIFFMLASSYQQTAALDLALATPAATPTTDNPLILNLPREGVFVFKQQEYRRADLPAQLRSLADDPSSQGQEGLRPVLVLVGEQAPVDDLTFALAVLSAAGFSRIATAAESGE